MIVKVDLAGDQVAVGIDGEQAVCVLCAGVAGGCGGGKGQGEGEGMSHVVSLLLAMLPQTKGVWHLG